MLRTEDRDLALLAGDRLYALGLALLAEQGDLAPVGVLADLISRVCECARRGRAAPAPASAWSRAPRPRCAAPTKLPGRPSGRYCSPSFPDRNARSCLTPARLPSPSTPPTATIAGAFEGETVTRRRFMTLTAHGAGAVAAAAFLLPALGFAAGSAIFERPEVAVGDGRRARRLPGRHLRAEGRHRGLRASARSARRRSTCAPATTAIRAPNPEHAARGHHGGLHRDLHALHAPRLPGALRRRLQEVHLPVPRRRLRLHRQASPAARRCARSTASTCASRTARSQVGPRYSVNSEFRRFPSYRDPGQALDGIGQYLYPGRFSTPKLD